VDPEKDLINLKTWIEYFKVVFIFCMYIVVRHIWHENNSSCVVWCGQNTPVMLATFSSARL
jgi:hypothetical protein